MFLEHCAKPAGEQSTDFLQSLSSPDALAQVCGQLTEFQADRFGHPAGSVTGFLRGVSKDAQDVSQKSCQGSELSFGCNKSS